MGGGKIPAIPGGPANKSNSAPYTQATSSPMLPCFGIIVSWTSGSLASRTLDGDTCGHDCTRMASSEGVRPDKFPLIEAETGESHEVEPHAKWTRRANVAIQDHCDGIKMSTINITGKSQI